MLFEYLVEKFGENTPILVSDIRMDGLSDNALRQQIKKLTDSGKLKRYYTGVYFIPKDFGFLSETSISSSQVIEKKYLMDGDRVCGYVSGLKFANQIGVTTQLSPIYEIVSNKATRDYREIEIGGSKVVLRKPRATVTDGNYRILQFLDFMKDVDLVAELEGAVLTRHLLVYMESCDLHFCSLREYLPLYPDRIYRNLYETGLLNGISA